jgi:hypothetical protein
LSLVWVDGREISPVRVADDGLDLGKEGSLVFSKPRELRAGDVAESVFPTSRWLRRLLPASLRHLDERKWIASAALEGASGAVAVGSALYETVTWP